MASVSPSEEWRTIGWFGAPAGTRQISLRRSLFAQFVRSPHAYARFKVGDRETPAATPGVKAIYLASDFSNLGDLPCLAPTKNSDGRQTPLKPYPVMAGDEADHVGDIAAMIVADSALAARDGAEALAIDLQSLPAVADTRAALRPDAIDVFAGAPGNVAFDAHLGDKAKTDAVFAKAAHAVKIEIVNPRIVANYMEPRGAVGSFDPASGRLTLHLGSQGVHSLRDVLARVLKIPPTNLESSPTTSAAVSARESFSIGNIPSFSKPRAGLARRFGGMPTGPNTLSATRRGATT